MKHSETLQDSQQQISIPIEVHSLPTLLKIVQSDTHLVGHPVSKVFYDHKLQCSFDRLKSLTIIRSVQGFGWETTMHVVSTV